MLRLLATLTILMAISLPFMAMAGPDDAHGSVNLYSSSKEHLIRPLLEAFEQETGITTNVTTLGDSALVSRLKLEGFHTPADAVIVADVARLHDLQKRELLRPIESQQALDAVPALLRAEDNRWVGIGTRARLVFRRADDDEAILTDYRQLADEQWRDAVLIRSSDSVYNQSLLADLVYRFGEKEAKNWALGVRRNMARKPSGGDRDQLRALASGEGRLAVANSYYYALMLTGEDASDRAYAEQLVPMFMEQTPNGGTHVNVRGVGITTHANNHYAAERLVTFLTQPKAQRLLTELNHEYPANPDVEPSVLLRSWPAVPPPQVPLSAIGRLNAKATELFARVGWQ